MPGQGITAAPALVLKSIEGKSIDLRNPESKALLVNFWSTSCSICARELPILKQLHLRFSSRDFEIMAIAMPYDDPAEVRRYAVQRAIPFSIAIDIDGSITQAFPAVRFTPTTLLIDQSGAVVWRHTGKIDPAELIPLIESVMASPALASNAS